MKRDLTKLSSAPTTNLEQSKIDKEKSKKQDVKYDPPDMSLCGLPNPCKFGKHNKDFNKNELGKNH